jgi:multicomponent Na+:H+ antiporter subunit E
MAVKTVDTIDRHGRGAAPSATPMGKVLRGREFAFHWLILFAFWVVLSGMFDAPHLLLGLLSTGAVALVSYDMQLLRTAVNGTRALHLASVSWSGLLLYSLWLLREIAVANWQVLRIVFHPALPIDPALVRFRTHLRSDLGQTVLANSITLTPGTITVEVSESDFLVHALVAGEPVVVGISEIEAQVARAMPALEGKPAEIA